MPGLRKKTPSPAAVRKRLLAWFDRNKRDLPWRRTHDPYRIWLAEMMLQQTRVPTVIPYYRRFLRAFPTVEKLARARLEPVLRVWAGLGYYQRARHLHAAARVMARRHAGRFPQTLEGALALPGVGAYTARAILSIAYREPLAVVDGNVARVLVRLFRLSGVDPADRASLQGLADRLVSRERPGDFNQALMELGSTRCLPRAPRCSACPLETLCAARRAGVEGRIPRPRAKRPRPTLTLSLLALRRNGRLLLVREALGPGSRDNQPRLFSGLWHFPYARGARPDRLARTFRARRYRPVARLVHQTTMRDLALHLYEAVAGHGIRGGRNARWVPLAAIERLGVGAATRKAAAALGSHP